MLTAQQAREALEYAPETGLLRWKKRGRGRKLGAIAGANREGRYSTIKVLNRYYPSHRVIWLIVHGKWPDGQIDHINRIPSDNRICNLRDVSPADNLANKGVPRNNTTGFKGVYKNPQGKPWKASIMRHEQFIHLGCFDDPAEAHEAYLKAYLQIHGEEANLSAP